MELVGALKDVEEWKEESSEDGGCVRMEGGHFGGGWCSEGCVRYISLSFKDYSGCYNVVTACITVVVLGTAFCTFWAFGLCICNLHVNWFHLT